ncbi:hypothetical protein HNP46_005024 [Pseudomonas nitritireducens]|uniref:Uncharacterized protein n=1 Tax=Pseudomonas nitroreducens TaxID=46680 RepID=A0A7W7P3S0_PSENT|nr:hypothetical protein [Pseudomonas nitritireducens]
MNAFALAGASLLANAFSVNGGVMRVREQARSYTGLAHEA